MKTLLKLLCLLWASMSMLGASGCSDGTIDDDSETVSATELGVGVGQRVFYDNTFQTTFPGAFRSDHEIADDVTFTGTHTVAGFSIFYHADIAVNATFKFYTVNQSTGRPGTTVATFNATNLAAGDHVFDVNLGAGQQFNWTATSNIYNLGSTATGGFFSVRFTPIGSGPLGISAGVWEAGFHSFDGLVDVTTNQFFNFQGDTNASFYVEMFEAGTPAAPALSALRAPNLFGGPPNQGLVTLTNVAPAGGTTVALESTDPTFVIIPSSVTIPAGATSATFPITTTPVSQLVAASISATLNGLLKTASVTLNPPVPQDTISITLAQWKKKQQLLQTAATGSNTSALLKVTSTASGATIGFMSNTIGNQFVGNFSWPVNPGQITVLSSFGGSATANVAQLK